MIGFTALFQMRPFQPPLWVPTGRNRGYRAARRRVDAFINGLIAARRPQPEVGWPDDLLSKLMRARDESTGAGMSEQLLRDEAVTLFFAGHETTARTLTFAWFALSQNPGVLARLQAEVDRQLGDREPTPADLAAMPYALQVIKETLRLHPPAPMYVRDAVTDDILDGVRIPAGSRVLLLPYCTHRHPDFWPDAESFEPARWEAEAESRRHPYAYHPFAAGPRVCLGNSYPLFESHLLLVMLARRFSASMKPGHDPKIDMAGTLVARNGIPLQISLRA
jgi:cytochrome P450